MKDDAYDFNYQETRMLKEERELKMGDSIQLICDYKTKDIRTNMTVVSKLEYQKKSHYPKKCMQCFYNNLNSDTIKFCHGFFNFFGCTLSLYPL